MIREPISGHVEAPRLERARGATTRWTLQTSPLILLVGDDTSLPDSLVRELSAFGLRAEIVRDGLVALVEIGRQSPGAIVIGRDLGSVATAAWVATVHESVAVPVYLALGDSAVDDARAAFEAGVSGVISGVDLSATIARRVTDRWRTEAGQRPTIDHVVVGPLELDVPSFLLRVHGKSVSVPLKEFELMTCLMANGNRIVSNDDITEWLWGTGPDRPSQKAIASHMKKLREHLGDPELIRTIRGQGYTVSHLA